MTFRNRMTFRNTFPNNMGHWRKSIRFHFYRHSWFERWFHYASQYSELLCLMLVCLFGLWVLLKDTPNLRYIVVWYVTPRLASAELQLPSRAGNNSVSLAIRFPGIDVRTSKLVMLGRTSALGFWKWETLIITDSGGQENGCRWPVPFLVLLLHVL